MSVKKCVFAVVLLVTITGWSVSAGTTAPPVITSPHLTEITVDPGENFTFSCEGDALLFWTHPNTSDRLPTEALTKENGKYVSSLELTNITYRDVGYYICYRANNPEINSSVYLFVKDAENLLTHDIFFVPIHGMQYGDIVIPCKPTHPSVKVELCYNFIQKLVIGENDDIGVIRYNNKVGYILENAQIRNNGYYCCMLTGDVCSQEECHRTYSLEVLRHADSVTKPAIDDAHLQHVTVGDNVTLPCKVSVPASIRFTLDWIIPNETERFIVGRDEIESREESGHQTGRKKLTIINAQLSDAGNYTCIVRDHAGNTNSETTYLRVYRRNEAYIQLTVPGNKTEYEIPEGENLIWAINVEAHPPAVVQWFRNQDIKPMENSSTVSIMTKSHGKQAVLEIKNVEMDDRGVYQINATNEYCSEHLYLKLAVLGKPDVDMQSSPLYFLHGTSQHVNCTVYGKPRSTIYWFFQPYSTPEINIPQSSFKNYTNAEYETVSEIEMNATTSGILKCFAHNKFGNDSGETQIIITDVADGVGMLPVPEEIVEGDNVTLTCQASKYTFTGTMKWFRQLNEKYEEEITEEYSYRNGLLIERGDTDYSHQTRLIIKNASQNDSGEYKCVAYTINATQPKENYQRITVLAVISPTFSKDTNMNGGEHLLDALSQYSLNCKPVGVPTPHISWLKDNRPFHLKLNDSSIEFMHKNTTVVIKQFKAENAGMYTCIATNPRNKNDKISVTATLKFKDEGGIDVRLIVIVVVSILLIGISIFLAIKIRKDRKNRREQKISGLMHFREGAIGNMNPDLPVDEQAELLPYDKKWEFPREKLRLGKQLGSGAFGVVMKADAFGIMEEEPLTVVAVKMVKRNSDYTYIKALASELKIMVHLGKHLNVVNLLGACTNNITKKELLVIVEYCRFGNLHNYLLRHRDEFIDQIDQKTGKVDPTIGADKLERADSFSNRNRVKYAALAFTNSHSGGDMAVDYRAAGAMLPSSSSSESDADHISMLPAGEDDCVLSNNSTQPEWRSNYRGDYKGNVRPICTRDLICWAFQVARGMEYLASRKVLHGDLAARNILLADNNIVKICDFGLAKSMYKSNNYKKKGDGPLPVKWMAIESIRDRIFSTQSDVWSYGIVLWEFFSLARTPYPGMEADEKLYNKLLDGYRMEKPQYATVNIYQTMLDCWHLNPNKRPMFTELSERMGNMLEDSVRRHYIDLNDPYMDMNSEWMQNTQSDYLSMMSAPTYGNLVSPQEDNDNDYINSPLPGTAAGATGGTAGSGYLCMGSPSTSDAVIFSPHNCRSDGNVFTFDNALKAKSHVKEAEANHGAELRPMLNSITDSESEQHVILQDVNMEARNGHRTLDNESVCTPSFSNPAYHSIGCISPSADNYVNMPQQKNFFKGKDSSKVAAETSIPAFVPGYVSQERNHNDFNSSICCNDAGLQNSGVKHEGYVNLPNNNTTAFNGIAF